jgi:hypothetical protein
MIQQVAPFCEGIAASPLVCRFTPLPLMGPWQMYPPQSGSTVHFALLKMSGKPAQSSGDDDNSSVV